MDRPFPPMTHHTAVLQPASCMPGRYPAPVPHDLAQEIPTLNDWRPRALAILCSAAFAICPVVVCADVASPEASTAAPSVAASVTPSTPASPSAAAADSFAMPDLVALRETYDRAWKLRQNGDAEAARLAAERALMQIREALTRDPEASMR